VQANKRPWGWAENVTGKGPPYRRRGAKAFSAFPLLFLLEMIFCSQPSRQPAVAFSEKAEEQDRSHANPTDFFLAVQTRPPFEMCSGLSFAFEPKCCHNERKMAAKRRRAKTTCNALLQSKNKQSPFVCVCVEK